MHKSAFLSAAATLALGAVAISAAIAEATPAITQVQCESLWNQALAGSSGDVSKAMAKPYVTDFKKADKNGDEKLSQTEWVASCGDRLIHSKAPTSSDGASDGASGASGQAPTGTSDRTPGPSSTPDRPTPSRPY